MDRSDGPNRGSTRSASTPIKLYILIICADQEYQILPFLLVLDLRPRSVISLCLRISRLTSWLTRRTFNDSRRSISLAPLNWFGVLVDVLSIPRSKCHNRTPNSSSRSPMMFGKVLVYHLTWSPHIVPS